jgi:hypothetical protein
MDNSAQNPYNPDPSRPVRFGLQTMHEMFFGFLNLRYVGHTPDSLAGSSTPDKVSAAPAASATIATRNNQTALR